MPFLGHTFDVLGLCAILIVFAYFDGVYRALGKVASGRLHVQLDAFETEIEPRLKIERRRAALGFSILTNVSLIAVAAETVRGVLLLASTGWQALAQLVVYLLVELLFCVHFVPYLLLSRTRGGWVKPLLPAVRAALLISWPARAMLELAISVAHISDEEAPAQNATQQEGIEALVEAAQEEGILASDEAHLIEQVVEFSDKRVLELMTPRLDIVAIPASATIEQMRRLLVETKFSRVVVYQETLDDTLGIAQVQDLLQVPESETKRRTVRELVRPVLFVPETKHGSDLLKEMQRRNEHMAIAVDEHGQVSGVVTVEDLVEEIVGEMSNDDSRRAPDVVREGDGSVILRGSVSVDKLQELFGVELADAETAKTVAGLLNGVAGHVPQRGENIDYDGLRFEVMEANQRKVLRLRVARRQAAAPAAS